MGLLAIDPAMMRDRAFDEVVGAVAEAGFDAIEWATREDFLPANGEPRASAERVRQLRVAAERERVSIASLAAFYDWASPDEAVRAQAVAWFRRAIEVCAELDCPSLNTELKGDISRSAASEEAFRRSIDELLPGAEQLGVRIDVEPHPYDFIEASNVAADLVRSIGSRHLGYLYCAPHMYIMGTDPAEMIEHAADVLTHVHIGDTFRPSRYITNPQGTGVRVHQHLDIGLGEVDFTALFASLAAARFNGLLAIAVFAHPERARASFRTNRERVLGFMEKASQQFP